MEIHLQDYYPTRITELEPSATGRGSKTVRTVHVELDGPDGTVDMDIPFRLAKELGQRMYHCAESITE